MSKATKSPPASQADAALEARLATLRAEIDEIMAALAAKAEAEKAEAEAKVEDAAETAANAAGDISDEILRDARRALKQIHKQAATLEKTLGVQARSNPLQSLLIAFGLGFIVSLLLTRR